MPHSTPVTRPRPKQMSLCISEKGSAGCSSGESVYRSSCRDAGSCHASWLAPGVGQKRWIVGHRQQWFRLRPDGRRFQLMKSQTPKFGVSSSGHPKGKAKPVASPAPTAAGLTHFCFPESVPALYRFSLAARSPSVCTHFSTDTLLSPADVAEGCACSHV